MIAWILTMSACIDLATLGRIESGNDDSAIGAAGERGRYQISMVAWREVMASEPHQNAHDPRRASIAARRYLELCARRFEARRGRKPSAKELWLCWNLGVEGALRARKFPAATQRGLNAITQ